MTYSFPVRKHLDKTFGNTETFSNEYLYHFLLLNRSHACSTESKAYSYCMEYFLANYYLSAEITLPLNNFEHEIIKCESCNMYTIIIFVYNVLSSDTYKVTGYPRIE